ncbi:acyl-CoA carboxylase subunit beta [Parvularcula lutaonensis]|uniref:Acyl-CoA carboxylase subunit beta n=1 Tax=Parvularcula lutaonensis TaxID=491923 RepID=A0ABV7MCL0_9PROT|nr:carboxyl transferase domain-containing protein [Parvularcula lutaonensis]GGY38090.1 acetyl-CoA carboxylase carboxyltransferase subunit [Parvularcula lutaonensis]
MSVYSSRIDTNSDGFAENRKDMLALIERLQELNARGARLSASKAEKFEKRGQLLPRERLARLLDPGMPFLAIGNLTGYMVDTDKEERSVPGSTIIAGIGYVSGRRCVVTVDDSAIKAGALTTGSAQRFIRCEEIALEQNLPFVHLVESAGGDLKNYTVEGFIEGGSIFANLARLSAQGVPTVAVLHGSSTAGGAYMPGLSDYVVAVKDRGKAFLAGPPLLKAATGEVADDESLGGAQMHADVSGLVDMLAEDDAEAILMAREIVSRLPETPDLGGEPFEEPVYPTEELAGVVPTDYRKPYDVREIIARIVDGSDFTDFKERIGSATVCVFASIFGQRVGILGNNGPIDNPGAHKAAQFLQLCDSAQTPVVFLQNTTGYMVGVEHERLGMIKNGSKMIQAVANLRVPRITVQVGASFGAGNYGMCGRGFRPDFVVTWPNAMTGVMGGEQAGKVMRIVAEAQAAAKGEEPNKEMLAFQEAALKHMFDNQADAFTTSGRNCDDGVIDPRDTRRVLGFLLATCLEGRARTLQPNAFGVARM